jgi:PIN domain nuclease of toxin-antitoxin system
LNARLLLDTHVVIRWLAAPKKLPREQVRVLRVAVRRREPVAAEVAALGGSLRDPADRAMVATGRVNRLRLVTSAQCIIDSKLVPVVAY